MDCSCKVVSRAEIASRTNCADTSERVERGV